MSKLPRVLRRSRVEAMRPGRLAARRALERAGALEFKPVSSAKWVDIQRVWTGVITVRIEHDNIRGCTPQMIRWWFENLGRSTTWDGVGFDGPEVSFYHLWHHRDHVAITPLQARSAGFTGGGLTRIEEQFNDFHDKVCVDVVTDRLDDAEFNFTGHLLGQPVVRIVHRYAADGDESSFYAETRVGLDIPVVGWIFNWLVLPFMYSKRSGERWIRHNIEETGRSEQVIPVLYDHHAPPTKAVT